MSDDERTCCDCRYEGNIRHIALTCRRCKENGGDQDNFEPKLPLRPPSSRVDIDATGRKALCLGTDWVWCSAEWRGSRKLYLSMARKKGEDWGSLRIDCVVEAIDFVYEEE